MARTAAGPEFRAELPRFVTRTSFDRPPEPTDGTLGGRKGGAMNRYAAASAASDAALPLENFIQAVQSQLDKAQTAMTLKARNLNMPLTFAIKDITLDLRAHVEFAKSEIRIRPAGAERRRGERLPSRVHRDHPADDRGERRGADGRRSRGPRHRRDRRRQSVTRMSAGSSNGSACAPSASCATSRPRAAAETVQRVTGLPVNRLRAALERASAPLVEHVTPVERSPGDTDEGPPLIRLRGRNLLSGGGRRASRWAVKRWRWSPPRTANCCLPRERINGPANWRSCRRPGRRRRWLST